MINDEKIENNNKSPENATKNKSPVLSSPNDTKKEKKKRNRKKKNDKNAKSKNILSPDSNNFSDGILSEIKQISIPTILSEKENLFKILQSEIINIDKSLSLLNKKKKYYNEIIQKLIDEIQNEKKNLKKTEIKNQEYLYMENILKDYNINDTFDNCEFISNNSYYNINKVINANLDSNFFSLHQNNNKNYLIINFFDEKNNTLNNKMEQNCQLSYEEFNTISELDDNFCLLMSKEKNKVNDLQINNNNNEFNIIDNNKIDIEDNQINTNNNIEFNNINDNKIDIEDSHNINIEDNNINNESEENKLNNINNILRDTSSPPFKNKIELEDEDFEIIAEAPPEQEETTNKNRKKISIENEKFINKISDNKNKINEIKEIEEINLDKSINKKYSNNLEELDFYSLKDNKINDIKENKKKKITFEDIQKKYKTQDMGSDFVSKDQSSKEDISSEEEDNSAQEKQNKKIKKRKQKKKKNKNINNTESDINKSDEIEEDNNNLGNLDNSDVVNKIENNNSDISEISNNIDDNNKNKKKKGRKKKKKEEKLVLCLEEELPDPENLDNVGLALEMKKYGMKPQNKKRNIEILKGVYNFLKIKELPENIAKKLASFDLDIDENNTDSENENKIRSKKKEDNSNITELSDEQKRNIIDIIKENKSLYEKILLFKEVSIKEIKTLLVSKGIIIQNHLLSKFLIDSGVILPGGWNNKK